MNLLLQGIKKEYLLDGLIKGEVLRLLETQEELLE
jgi:hypothetical protein